MSKYFVRGLSRSGGTLMATILDAHPDVAMSYETYQHLLDCGPDNSYGLTEILDLIGRETQHSIKKVLLSKQQKTPPEITKFVGRAARAGIDTAALARLFVEHFESGLKLDSFSGRMHFIERLTREKMHHEGKKHWGAKIVSVYDQLDELYPDAYYLFMIRDGRDIAASRKKVGDFKQSVVDIAQGWKKQISKFEKFAACSGERAFFVSYEKMALEPERELRVIMEKLGLPWSDRILAFHELNLSIHRNATGHLSGEQVKQPISTMSIGRWKTDLTSEEVSQFEEHAGDMLSKLGYR